VADLFAQVVLLVGFELKGFMLFIPFMQFILTLLLRMLHERAFFLTDGLFILTYVLHFLLLDLAAFLWRLLLVEFFV
jgi:hypothetical protein